MIASGLTDSFRVQQSDGLHRPEHEYRLALYDPTAPLGPETPGYSPQGEVTGQGYEPGGIVLSGRQVSLVNGVAVTDWDDAVLDPATINAFGGLVFNASLPGYPSVAVIAFDSPVSSTNGPFKVPMARLIQWVR